MDRSSSEKIVSGLLKVCLAVRSQSWQNAEVTGMSPTQGQIVALLFSNNGVPMRLSEIANALAITSATASDAVSSLVEKNLLQKNRAPNDARAVAISLTELGIRQANNMSGWKDFLSVALKELSIDEGRIFLRGLIKIIKSLQDQHKIPISRMCVTCRFFLPNVHSNEDNPHHCAFVDAPFGDSNLRLDCPDQLQAKSATIAKNWQEFC